ncbi:DUF308 domain-containing protein [Treponema brennaborense]|uniref:DUF308 domain-containing protein n=1 Tax=Treponema brennaborense (strain DSM 12168 / CIP 105900 / DD5/3) TaxID=906968 RepID=F4LKL7_TREBD|nr:DUF308 domain-containing protein [Treponema brennaborense]AEE17573.1 hypothetical protein Trebr_2158 [Treponema brennaborense DSM 12168]
MRKTYIGLGILTIVIGLLMLLSPNSWIAVMVIILGSAAILNGVFNLFYLRSIIDDPYYRNAIIIRGILSIIVGLLAIILPLAIAGFVWTVMTYTLAVYLLVSAGIEIYAALKMKAAGIPVKPYYSEIVVSVILAIVLFIISPSTLGTTLIRICGVLLILTGIGVIFWEWKNRNYVINPDSVENAE